MKPDGIRMNASELLPQITTNIGKLLWSKITSFMRIANILNNMGIYNESIYLKNNFANIDNQQTA